MLGIQISFSVSFFISCCLFPDRACLKGFFFWLQKGLLKLKQIYPFRHIDFTILLMTYSRERIFWAPKRVQQFFLLLLLLLLLVSCNYPNPQCALFVRAKGLARWRMVLLGGGSYGWRGGGGLTCGMFAVRTGQSHRSCGASSVNFKELKLQRVHWQHPAKTLAAKRTQNLEIMLIQRKTELWFHFCNRQVLCN